MLSRLFIQNYAIISQVDIEFSPQLNIITGETGAGKSILVGALGLVLGDRADSSVLRDKEKKAVVEAVFEYEDLPAVDQLLQQWEIETGSEVILRREVSSAGKSRAFVNDTPVNLSQLQQLSALFVDLHQQFDTQLLGRNAFQLEVLDALAGHQSGYKKYVEKYRLYSGYNLQLTRLREQLDEASREMDYYRFLYDEINEAGFRENEIEELEAELKVLSHAEQIKSALGRVCYELKDAEQPMVQQLKSLINQLHPVEGFHSSIGPVSERLQSAYIELRDISDELESINENVQMDAGRMDDINTRIALGQKLFKKHHVTSTTELIRVKKELESRLENVLSAGEEMTRLEKQMQEAFEEVKKLAAVLTTNRKKQIRPLETKTAELLTRVGMPNARLRVDMMPAEPGPDGADQISFLFDANKTNRFEPLQKVASGGELSRLMLSLKSLVARSVQMPTLIFDEIDSGISGEAARQVGILMKELGRSHQVISITHQPQIAARADAHFYVFKKESAGGVITHIRRLTDDERVEAIAKMLGGEKPTAVALENAREMVQE